ncbi:hypothetical protein E2C01_073891 [Portunus trituberculatus]|uniref:Uncharacterized protein n=1 Tax=Portunus trituberculatus TaxID=210409 RepID=A0A5B7ICV9_PORTR|nr:hypothetical protein [Portunus trituberculatus]
MRKVNNPQQQQHHHHHHQRSLTQTLAAQETYEPETGASTSVPPRLRTARSQRSCSSPRHNKDPLQPPDNHRRGFHAPRRPSPRRPCLA